jgi:hypothetical protein
MSTQFNQQRIHAIRSRLIALSDNPHYIAERRALTAELSRRSAMQPGEYELPILQEGITMKLTNPQSCHFPPTIPGVYLTYRNGDGVHFWRAFDGNDWYYGIIKSAEGSPSYEVALRKAIIRGVMVNFQWQGLAEKPE